MTEPNVTFDVNLNDDDSVKVKISDIKIILSMIDVVQKRGGFTPRDFSSVGSIYDTLIKYVN